MSSCRATNANRIDPILARLRAAWIARPDLRLGQLIAGSLAIGGAEDKFARLFNAECAEFGAANAPIEWPPVDRPAPTPAPDPLATVRAALDAMSAHTAGPWPTEIVVQVLNAAPAIAELCAEVERLRVSDAEANAALGDSLDHWDRLIECANNICAHCKAPFADNQMSAHVAACSQNPMVALIAELRENGDRLAREVYASRRDTEAALDKLSEAKRLGLEACALTPYSRADHERAAAIAAALEAL